MSLAPAPEELARELPGRWVIRATNFPMWLRGDRTKPTIEYGLLAASPLRLSDSVEYDDQRGGRKTIRGADRWRRDRFVWRGAGLLALVSSRWIVSGLDGDVLAIRFEKSALTPAGIDVLVREGSDITELRQQVSSGLEGLGISVEEYASLSWLDHPGH